jgi:hypothetical protein
MAEEDLPPGLAPEDEDDDDTRDDATALFGIDLGDGSVAPTPINPDGGGGGGVTPTENTNCDGSAPSITGKVGKRKSPMWADFDEIFETMNGQSICTKTKCKMCKTTLSARSSADTGHLKRHQKTCRDKTDQRARVQSRLAYNPDGSMHNWDYKPDVAKSELCCLITRLDLPLGIGETDDWKEYIVRAHNPRFVKVSRQTTTKDLSKLFNERRNLIKNFVLAGASSVALTSDIWSGNVKEDYISVVAHYVSADWELQKKIIGLRLIGVKHTGENIAEKIGCVIQEFDLLDKIFSVTLDNASSNTKAMETLKLMFASYLGFEPDPDPLDPNKVEYNLLHQCCACHIINLIVKSGLKRFKAYAEDFRTAINFLNSSNQRIAMFKNYLHCPVC